MFKSMFRRLSGVVPWQVAGVVVLSAALCVVGPIGLAMADAASTVDLHPVLTDQTIWQAITGAALALNAWLLPKIGMLLKIKIDDSIRDYVGGIIVKGILQAQAKFGALPLTVDVGSPFIAEAVRFLVNHAPAGLKWFGIDPSGDAVKNMVAARVQEMLNSLAPPIMSADAATQPAPATPPATAPATV